MSIEGMPQFIPPQEVPKTEKPETEISPEKRKQAESTILDTLEIGSSTENLDNFDEKLKKATESLPRYQQIKEKLEGIEQKNLPHELFKVLKRDSDEEQTDPNVPKDGVLIKSMRQGKLECAGRTLIASTFLQERKIDHVAVSAPGHSFLVIEQSPDTLTYFDANNNLFFTFPRTALEGYQGAEISAECRLKEYTPREADFADGVNTVFSHFVAMPAREAVGRHYLGNVAAALNGNEEFKTTGIVIDQEASEAVHQIESEIYEQNKVYQDFLSRFEIRNSQGEIIGGLLEDEKMQTANDKKVIGEILENNPTHDKFIASFTMELNGNIGNRILYIKNATDEQKGAYAEKVWGFLQNKQNKQNNINEMIRGR